MKEICKECTRKCQQAICCICEYYNICECSKIEPSKEVEGMNNMFKRKKHKCDTKSLNQYPCDIYLKNALHFISIEQPSDAYEEICYAIISSGGELSDEERRTFEMLRRGGLDE